MSRYNYGGWAPYVPVAERRRMAAREAEKLSKKGHPTAPVRIEGRRIASTFWGKAWCDNIESYHDYENRLPRGRSYVRNGSVVDLQISPGKVAARVSGSRIYSVAISITQVAKNKWASICADCTGGIASVVELLQGRLSKGVMERLCRQDAGLFPKPSEISFTCSCPDYASMCKHVAATLYGVGARLDHKPELLFHLRAVNQTDLIAKIDTTVPMSKKSVASGKVLLGDDVSALFGLDMAQAPAIGALPGKPKPPGSRRKASAPKKVAAVKAAASKKRASRSVKAGAGVARPPRTDKRPRSRKKPTSARTKA